MSPVEELAMLSDASTAATDVLPDALGRLAHSAPPHALPSPPSVPPRDCTAPQRDSQKYFGTPWMKRLADLPSSTPVPELLGKELLAFHDYIKPIAEEVAFRHHVVGQFEHLVRRLWPDARVVVFGSLATELFLPDGDLDLTILCPSLSHLTPSHIFSRIRTLLLDSAFVSSSRHVETILGARVPILKFLSSSSFGALNFDVSLGSEKGPEGARVCRELLRELERKGRAERVRRLILWWKVFLRSRGLHMVRDGGLGGLSAFCMVAHYCQLDPRRLGPSPSPAEDLFGFLLYYGYQFDYPNQYIDLSRGGYLGSKKARGWYKASFPQRLSIQHPVDRDRDLSSGSYAMHKIIEAIREACITLRRLQTNDEDTRLLPLGEGKGNGALSCLGMRITRELGEHRERNRRLWAGMQEEIRTVKEREAREKEERLERRARLKEEKVYQKPPLYASPLSLPPSRQSSSSSLALLASPSPPSSIISLPSPGASPSVTLSRPSSLSSPPPPPPPSFQLAPLRLFPTLDPPCPLLSSATLSKEEFNHTLRTVESYNALAAKRNAELKEARDEMLWKLRKAGIEPKDAGVEWHKNSGAVVRGLYRQAEPSRLVSPTRTDSTPLPSQPLSPPAPSPSLPSSDHPPEPSLPLSPPARPASLSPPTSAEPIRLASPFQPLKLYPTRPLPRLTDQNSKAEVYQSFDRTMAYNSEAKWRNQERRADRRDEELSLRGAAAFAVHPKAEYYAVEAKEVRELYEEVSATESAWH